MKLRTQVVAGLVVVAVVAAGMFACSSFSGSDQAGGSPPVDAASGVDAPVMSIMDATPVPPPAPGTFCSSVDASFCWSFDEELYLRGPVLQPGIGDLPTITSAAKSAPNAMQVGPDAGETSDLVLHTDSSTSMHCELDLVIDTIGNGSTNVLYFVEDKSLITSYAILLNLNKGGVEAYAEVDNTPTFIANLSPGTWAHISLEVSQPDGGRQAVGYVDSTHAMAVKPAANNVNQVSNLNAHFGVDYDIKHGWSIRYDNLVCSWN